MSKGLVAGKLALVTGAGSGIGRATCRLLAREGATVIAADRNYEAAVQTVKTDTVLAAHSNDDHSALELDVADSASIQSALQATLKQYKRPPSIVVNSAGIARDNWMLKMSEEDYDNVLDVNLKGTFLVLQAFGKAMVDAGVAGSIVNISSIVGKYGNMVSLFPPLDVNYTLDKFDVSFGRTDIDLGVKGQTNYAASKAGIVGMTKSAAKELGKYNIRVNAILPGMIDTPIQDTVPEKVKQMALFVIPLGRIGQPAEVAEVVTFLSSDRSSFVTGATIDVTGGY